MAAFKGQAEYSVDSKGRLAVPAKMRGAMNPEANQTLVMTRGLEKCIFLYPLDRWKEIEGEISSLNSYSSSARRFTRLLMRWAEEVTFDSQGRIKLSKSLMEFAGITGKGLVLGALDRIEVWDPEVFETYLNDEGDDYETLAERVMG